MSVYVCCSYFCSCFWTTNAKAIDDVNAVVDDDGANQFYMLFLTSNF